MDEGAPSKEGSTMDGNGSPTSSFKAVSCWGVVAGFPQVVRSSASAARAGGTRRDRRSPAIMVLILPQRQVLRRTASLLPCDGRGSANDWNRRCPDDVVSSGSAQGQTVAGYRRRHPDAGSSPNPRLPPLGHWRQVALSSAWGRDGWPGCQPGSIIRQEAASSL